MPPPAATGPGAASAADASATRATAAGARNQVLRPAFGRTNRPLSPTIAACGSFRSARVNMNENSSDCKPSPERSSTSRLASRSCRSGSPRTTSRRSSRPGDAVPVIEDCFRRMAAGEVELMPRRRFAVEGGYFAVMAAADRGLGVAGLKSYTLVEGELAFVVCLFDLSDGSLTATDRGRPARSGADGRRERRRGEAPRATGRDEPRADRSGLAGGVAARRDPGGRADDRAGRRLEPDARAGRGVRRRARCGGRRDARRRRRRATSSSR